MQIQLDLTKTPFSLDHTLSCGQTFRWEKQGDAWIGIVGQTALRVRQKNGVLEFRASFSENVKTEFVSSYFRLDDDLPKIYSRIMKDKYVHEAVKQFYGLRLIRQEPWECLISYICATYKNIPAIKQMIASLSRRFGSSLMFEGRRLHGFPEPKALADASLHELRRCELGYRAVSVRATARLIDKGDFDVESLKTMPYKEGKKMLMTLPGVGPKVADCVLLFSLDKLEAFPIDVWMKRILLKHYSQCFESRFVKKTKSKRSFTPRQYQFLYDFGRQYFGEYVGYAQEYLYHYERYQRERA